MAKIAVLLALALLSTTTLAKADDISDQARKCWNLLPSDMGLGGTVAMTVTLDTGGLVTGIEVNSYAPDDARGYAIAQAAARAVETCAPYPEHTGEIQVLLDVHGGERSPNVSIPTPGSQ